MLTSRFQVAMAAGLLLTLTHDVGAAPIAQWTPASGAVYFVGLEGVYGTWLESSTTPLIFENAIGPPHQRFGDYGILWHNNSESLDPGFFGGNVVPIGPPANQLSFSYSLGTRPRVLGQIVQVPEATTFAMLASSVLALGMIRRFRRPA
jgi:hypothetical protein